VRLERGDGLVVLVEFLLTLAIVNVPIRYTDLHNAISTSSIEDAGTQGQCMHIARARLQTPHQLSGLQVPYIDFAIKSTTVKERALSRERKYRFALFSAVFKCVDARDSATLRWIYPPQ
jgi:hypothetical protein